MKAEQQADASTANISFFIISILRGLSPVCVGRPCPMIRPQRTTVLTIVAEPVEKPDARVLSVVFPIVHGTDKSIGFKGIKSRIVLTMSDENRFGR